MLLSAGIGLLWGLRCGYKKDSLADRFSTTALIILNAVPTFLIGLGLDDRVLLSKPVATLYRAQFSGGCARYGWACMGQSSAFAAAGRNLNAGGAYKDTQRAFVNRKTEKFSKKPGSPVMRQRFPASCVAFSVALIPPFWRCHRSDRSPPRSASKPSSTGRLTHSKPDSTVSNPLLLRCLASCFSDDGKEECARETQEGCPAPVKSSVFRTMRSENLHSGRISRPLCPFRFRRKGTHPRCRYSAKNCQPSWSILRTGVVIMPYGTHECLRPHRGVDLTGKLRD